MFIVGKVCISIASAGVELRISCATFEKHTIMFAWTILDFGNRFIIDLAARVNFDSPPFSPPGVYRACNEHTQHLLFSKAMNLAYNPYLDSSLFLDHF